MFKKLSKIGELLNCFYQYCNRSNDKLHNPNDAYALLVYISMAFAIGIPVICFILFVYPTMTTYANIKTQAASVPLLEQQVKQLKTLYQSSRAALTELAETPSLAPLQDTNGTPYQPLDLHRLAHAHQLSILAMNTLHDSQEASHLNKAFSATRLSWHLKGHFFDYLAFKEALREQQPLIYMEREHLTPRENRFLDIVVDLSIYQLTEVAL